MPATIEDLDRRLTELAETSERVRANLLDVEVDPTYELLTRSALSGVTAERWGEASDAVTQLWSWHAELEGLVQRAREARGRRSRPSADEVAALAGLLDGASVAPAAQPVPLAQRSLLAPDARCTPAELLRRMSAAFDRVRDTLAAVAQAWDALLPRIETARRTLADCARLTAEVGEPEPVAQARREIDRAAADLARDPLSASPAALEAAEAALAAARPELEAADALRRDLDARLAAARSLLGELAREHEAAEVAYRDTVAKIAHPGVAGPPAVADDVAHGLERVEALAAAHDWHAAAEELARWSADVRGRLEAARCAAAAIHAPLEARNELRGLLAAYQGKAMRLGRIEDPELASLYDAANRALHVAPADLDHAADLVRRYQRALAIVPAAPEANR